MISLFVIFLSWVAAILGKETARENKKGPICQNRIRNDNEMHLLFFWLGSPRIQGKRFLAMIIKSKF